MPFDLRRPSFPIVRFALLALFVTWPAHALVLRELTVDAGRDEHNRIPRPVYDTTGLPEIAITDFAFEQDRSKPVLYKMTSSLLGPKPKYKSPRYVLEPGSLLETHVTEALRTEANAMGFSVTDVDTAGWRVGGTVHELVVEIRPSGGGFGPLLFFGYLDATVEITEGDGTTARHRWQHFDMTHIYNAGFGAQDEAREALARFLISAGQEIVARLNRVAFHAPPHPSALALLDGLDTDDDHFENAMLRIGLSGDPAAEQPLLTLLRTESDEADRANIVNALAHLGLASSLAPLRARFEDEDEDVRLFILKAMSYIGGEQSATFIRERGRRDPDLPVRMLASRYRPRGLTT